jgi:urease accessory protein
MVAVGLWAAQIGGRARWLVPVAFVAVFALGAALAFAGLTLPGVELTLMTSVLALGLLITVSARLPLGLCMALVGFFGLFHGIAHGAEIPTGAGVLSYTAGIVLATALLHGAGLGVGMLAGRFTRRIVQAAGIAIMACGVIAFAG